MLGLVLGVLFAASMVAYFWFLRLRDVDSRMSVVDYARCLDEAINADGKVYNGKSFCPDKDPELWDIEVVALIKTGKKRKQSKRNSKRNQDD